MGGTSTDVAHFAGEYERSFETQIAGVRLAVPMLRVHTVAAGGGSIITYDGTRFRVGPESAGADPGPICYGKGHRLTVTDANMILDRLRAAFFLGGAMPLTAERIAPAVAKLAWARGWKDIEDLAQGVVDVVNNNMEQAIRLISVERGHDPRDFTLFCFGGAGGLHAASLARGLGMRRVVVPPFPGALSALGFLLADARKDYSRTVLADVDESARLLKRTLDELHIRGAKELRAEGFKAADIEFTDYVDLRYRGQSYELTVQLDSHFVENFHEAHERRYGYANRGRPVELVNVRTTFTGRTAKPEFKKARRRKAPAREVDVQPVWIDRKRLRTKIYDRSMLAAGAAIRGPAIIGEYSSTTLVPPDFDCEVDEYLNLLLTRRL
jgi:N-methylhydantoinase A